MEEEEVTADLVTAEVTGTTKEAVTEVAAVVTATREVVAAAVTAVAETATAAVSKLYTMYTIAAITNSYLYRKRFKSSDSGSRGKCVVILSLYFQVEAVVATGVSSSTNNKAAGAAMVQLVATDSRVTVTVAAADSEVAAATATRAPGAVQ